MLPRTTLATALFPNKILLLRLYSVVIPATVEPTSQQLPTDHTVDVSAALLLLPTHHKEVQTITPTIPTTLTPPTIPTIPTTVTLPTIPTTILMPPITLMPASTKLALARMSPYNLPTPLKDGD